MAHTHQVNFSLTTNSLTTIGPGGISETGANLLAIDAVIAPSSTNVLQACAFTSAGLQSLVFLATTNLTVKTNSPGVNAVQTLTVANSPTGGTFTATFGGQTTAGINWNASAANVQTALVALSSILSGQIVCTGGPLPGSTVVCTFGGTMAALPESVITTNSAGLTGGSSPTATFATTTTGVAPGNTISLVAGMPFVWDRSCGYFANPFSVDVSSLYVTNSSAATSFKASILNS